jgi:hypothetical protein
MDAQLRKLISGGQTGVDRAALDVAIALGIPHGGWCPAGRLAEDGRIPAHYQLEETDAPEYHVRTERNVREADGTLVICAGPPTGGTALTCRLARTYAKPLLVWNLDGDLDAAAVRQWLRDHAIATLNVAGPRESTTPGIYARARDGLRELLV